MSQIADLDATGGEVSQRAAAEGELTAAELSRQEWISERQAILEMDAHLPRAEAERRAIEMRVDWVADRVNNETRDI